MTERFFIDMFFNKGIVYEGGIGGCLLGIKNWIVMKNKKWSGT